MPVQQQTIACSARPSATSRASGPRPVAALLSASAPCATLVPATSSSRQHPAMPVGSSAATEIRMSAAFRSRRHRFQEQPVQAVVLGQLGVEGDGEHVPLARGDGMPVDLGEDLHAGAVLGDPRARG